MYTPTFNAHERHTLLETAQEELAETINHPEVVRALGQQSVNAIIAYNNLLFVPNIRNGQLSIPADKVEGDDIPFVGLQPGETLTYDESVVEPTASQKAALLETVKDWWDLDDDMAQVEIQNMIGAQRTFASDATKRFGFGNSYGAVKPARVHLTVPQAQKGPSQFYLEGRPVLGLRASPVYDRPLTLAHELVHVGQHLAKPVLPSGRESIRLLHQQSELEAYHYSAIYGVVASALAMGDKNDFKTQLQSHTFIEHTRLKHAAPDQPFLPNEPMLQVLSRAGIAWAQDDFLR